MLTINMDERDMVDAISCYFWLWKDEEVSVSEIAVFYSKNGCQLERAVLSWQN